MQSPFNYEFFTKRNEGDPATGTKRFANHWNVEQIVHLDTVFLNDKRKETTSYFRWITKIQLRDEVQ